MKRIAREYAEHLKERTYVRTLVAAVLFLLSSALISYYAGTYATERASSSVTDIILSNTHVYDVDLIFLYGGLALFTGIIVMAISKPSRAPFVLKSVALFYIIRSAFITVTHIGPFPDHAIVNSTNFTRFFNFGGDLFFSGHTGLPFLIALIFWEKKHLRYFFLALSVFFGTVVLLGHLHYSIDVLSAYFITFSIYHLACYLFPSDLERLHQVML